MKNAILVISQYFDHKHGRSVQFDIEKTKSMLNGEVRKP